MSQQINLLNPALIKQKDLLNPINIVLTLGLLLVLMLAYYSYAQKQLSLLIAQRSQIAEQLATEQALLKQTALLHAPRTLNKALPDQIAQLEQKENMQQQVLQTVTSSSATPEKGYAALMRAFARQTINDLWLTGFSIDSNTDKLNISGRAMHANLVPEYIAHLSTEPALQGKLFSALNMHLANTNALSTKTPVIPPKTPQSPNNKTDDDTAQTPKTTPYIEFKLQSIDSNTISGMPTATNIAKDGGKS